MQHNHSFQAYMQSSIRSDITLIYSYQVLFHSFNTHFCDLNYEHIYYNFKTKSIMTLSVSKEELSTV